ncbi:MAG TPA: hypothetical protein VEE82_02890, partial [Thermodesulfovibrionales bacterium]|nr:hypothetical protein [Thermodesulfovibrionales bacterium]
IMSRVNLLYLLLSCIAVRIIDHFDRFHDSKDKCNYGQYRKWIAHKHFLLLLTAKVHKTLIQ